MTAHLLLIWDYDTAIGRVNATLPYNYREEVFQEEIDNVRTILTLGIEYDLPMTFACVGFAAEQGYFPYNVPEQIREIYAHGHELASHSWKHEWFPSLTAEQIERSLSRSKYSIEACVGEQGVVLGFVPPFNRPMSWYSRGQFSLGDRFFGPWYPGASIGSLLNFVAREGYTWCRVSYGFGLQTLIRDFWPAAPLATLQTVGDVTLIPQHYTGFDEGAEKLLELAVRYKSTLVIDGHPSALSRDGAENEACLVRFLERVQKLRKQGDLTPLTVQRRIDLSEERATK